MFLVGTGEFVGAVKAGIGAEIQVIVLVPVEDRINGADGWDGNRSGGKSFVFVGVVRGIVFQVAVEDTGNTGFLIF